MTLIGSLTPGGVAGPGLGTLTERLSQQEIAERVGASRDMVSRILQGLAASGYISIRSRRIDVLKPIPPA